MSQVVKDDKYYRNQKLIQLIMDKLYTIFRALLIIGIGFIIVFPLFQKVSFAFKDKVDIYNPTIYMVPQTFTLENISYAMSLLNYFPMLSRTLLYSGITTFLAAASCAFVGYGFARYKFPGSNIMFGLVLMTILVPTTTLMLPMYLQFKDFFGVSLLGTMWPSIIMSATAIGLKAGLFIYIFRQFFKGLPTEIEEASLIDGAGGVATFFRIMLPNSIPPIITVVLFSFVWQYNDTFYTSLLMSGTDLMSLKVATLPTQASSFIPSLMGYGSGSGFRADPNHVALVVDTGILMAIAPLVLMYVVVQRYFVESIERSGIVG